MDDQPLDAPAVTPSRLSLALGTALLLLVLGLLASMLLSRARANAVRVRPFTTQYLINDGPLWWRLRDACTDDADPTACAVRSARLHHHRWVIGEPGLSGEARSFTDFNEARRFVESKNAALRRSRRAPPLSEYFARAQASRLSDGNCASRGLRNYQRWATESSQTVLELDDDGIPDRFISYSIGDPLDIGAERKQYLRVELTSGAVIDTYFDYEWGWDVIGATDLNSDHKPEVWLLVDSTMKGGPIYGLATFEDCTVKRLTQPYLDGSVDSALITGYNSGASGHTNYGVECLDVDGDRELEIVQRSQDWERRFEDYELLYQAWAYTAYDVRGDDLVIVEQRSGATEADLPKNLDWSSEGLACESVAATGDVWVR